MQINHSLAQEIANKVMNVIPYNVNIMNDSGVIIGSGDSNRLNTIHEGAVEAITKREMIVVHDSSHGAKPGVNIPIYYRNRIIGVIGISGIPVIVSPLASLVKVTAELLINQEYLFNERRVKEQIMEEFLYHWAFRTEEYDDSFKNSGEAIGINLQLSRKAIIVKGLMERSIHYLQKNEYHLPFSSDSTLFIVSDESDFLTRLKRNSVKQNTRVGIGTTHQILAKSVQEAQRAIEIAEKLELTINDCFYHELKYIDFITNPEINFSEMIRHIQQLDEGPKGKELLETLISYINHNGDIHAISSELHIHRNSLAYRLNKIELLTSKNPKKFTELFQLYIGYVLFKMNREKG